MATYIPSNQSLATSALSNWGQGQRQQQSLNMRTAQSQLQELARLGISNEDPRKQKALGTIMAGGNSLAMLLNNSGDVPTLQSSQYQTGGGGGQPRQYAPSAQSQKKLSGLQSEEKGLMLQEAIRDERKKISEIDSAMKGLGDLAGAGTPEGDIDADIAKDLIREKDMAEFRLGTGKYKKEKGTLLDNLSTSDYWKKASSKKNIADGKYFLPDAKGKWKPIPKDAIKGIGETIAKPREKMDVVTKQIDKEKTQFLKDDAKRLNESVKTGGPMTGTETQMRAKVRRDFKILSDQAGGNTSALRKVYDDYVTDMKSIDYNFRRKPYYPSFEKQFASLFRGRKSSGGRSGGSGGSYSSGFSFFNPKTKTMSYVNEYGGKDRNDALAKLKKDPKYKDIADQLTADSIIGKEKVGARGVRNYNESLIKTFEKTRREQLQIKEFEQKKLNKSLGNLGNGYGKGFNDTDLKNALDSPGLEIKNKNAMIRALKDDSNAAALFRSITPEQKAMTLKYLDSFSTKESILSAVANLSKDPSKGMQAVARATGKKSSQPRTTVKNIAGQGNGRTKFNNKVDAL